jgi:secondary thiamine-phosphate synthase enzyme
MRQALHQLHVETRGEGLVEITADVAAFVRGEGISTGLVTLFCRHTSASLLIQENADPDVQADLAAFFARVAPADSALYSHGAEGPDDMPAHIRAALTQTQLSIPVAGGAMMLGAWQGIFVFEHRRATHRRLIALHLFGA